MSRQRSVVAAAARLVAEYNAAIQLVPEQNDRVARAERELELARAQGDSAEAGLAETRHALVCDRFLTFMERLTRLEDRALAAARRLGWRDVIDDIEMLRRAPEEADDASG